MTVFEFSLRLGTALLAGLAIGFERQWHHKTAGLRTNMLVAMGAAVFVLLSISIADVASGVDVSRITAQVVTGVGFLGAGIIFREGSNVHGLTSAATVWCSAAIGCLAATGMYMETLVASVFVIFINSLLMPLDKWLNNRK
ncbi:MgtC/SapB family protein [Maribacter sp. X9]|uniref:MgtC/SapB family protein n=1 Tax=Maribacter sp. X9 TaxID=3402159 RepID=UPI003AF3360F